jgi:phosphoribosylanthranilate isomerase
MRVKICGIIHPYQATAIASLGATALGFICVPTSLRYVTVSQIQAVIAELRQLAPNIDTIGVFANSTIHEITQIVVESGLTGIQLHGDESPDFCYQLRQVLPKQEIIKASRIAIREDLQRTDDYVNCVDSLLLAYHPRQLGGTGKTLDWRILQDFQPSLPWFLAGGLTPENVVEALSQVHPDGIDLSSGVERSPGDKDLERVALLFHYMGKSRGNYEEGTGNGGLLTGKSP